jgi:predicted nucleic acid-binding protein
LSALYAESSAVLAWLLGEPGGEAVRQTLAGAERVIASDLTLVECDRSLVRASTTRRVSEVQAADRRGLLAAAAAHWDILHVEAEVVDRARRPFPAEPLRTLDALHLASALTARAALPGLALLSLDGRVREAGHGLGFELLPEQAGASERVGA